MSKLAALDDLLELYYQLNYHQNSEIFRRLQEVQAWQKQRMQATHSKQFAEKQNVLMSEYFLNRLYGGPDFDALAEQIARLMKYAHKAEKLIPENAVKTGTSGVSLAILAVQLDEQVAMQLLEDYHPHEALNDEMMRLTYLKLDQGQSRLRQLDLLDQLGFSLDKYMRSFMVQTAFKMCKGAASKYNFDIMYEFMQDGFLAMKPLKSAEKFVKDFTAVERQIIHKVHAGDPHPF
ncbi:FFLEELY motif protein [Acinetobacter sp. G11]|uniref:FFLEELY motif protein n=1 Tax=Acinetobacter sp. G11 TaxID=3415989 RepID=UPI003C7C9142